LRSPQTEQKSQILQEHGIFTDLGSPAIINGFEMDSFLTGGLARVLTGRWTAVPRASTGSA